MNNISFFKLPLALVIIYYFFSIFANTVILFYLEGQFLTWIQVIEQIIRISYYLFPLILVILFCSSIVFNRYRIYAVKAKNILLLCLLVIITIFISYVYGYIILPSILSTIAIGNYFFTIISIFYFLSLISIYCSFMLLRKYFQYSEIDYITLNKGRSPKIHLLLFIILFMLINLSMIKLLSFYFYFLDYDISKHYFTYFCGYIILSDKK